GDEAEHEHRSREDQTHLERVPAELQHRLLGHWKLRTRELMSRFQPSTSTKIISLNGSEIRTGGSVIMPIEVRIDATTMSRTRKGMEPVKLAGNAVWRSRL